MQRREKRKEKNNANAKRKLEEKNLQARNSFALNLEKKHNKLNKEKKINIFKIFASTILIFAIRFALFTLFFIVSLKRLVFN